MRRGELKEDILEQAADWLERENVLSRAEQSEFKAWIEADRRHALAYEEMRSILLDEALMEAAISFRDEEVVEKASDIHKNSWWWRFYKKMSLSPQIGIGAGLVAVALIAIAIVPVMRDLNVPAQRVMNYASVQGENSQFSLSDSSIVKLRNKSDISVAFFDTKRVVNVNNGAAVFEVTKDNDRPFSVSAGGVDVTALGTIFSVDRLNSAIEIKVYEGSVRVRNSIGDDLFLKAKDGAIVESNLTFEKFNFSGDYAQDWTHGWTEVSDMQLKHLFTKLNRYSERKIVITAPEVESTRVTGRFQLADVKQTLKLVSALANVQIYADEENITISSE